MEAGVQIDTCLLFRAGELMFVTFHHLSERAVLCPHWLWLPGMRWVTVSNSGRIGDADNGQAPSGSLPDFSDPATFGCLLFLVRMAWKCPRAHASLTDTRRKVDNLLGWQMNELYKCDKVTGKPNSLHLWGASSEIEMLITALEHVES